jgi:hypothetical protein
MRVLLRRFGLPPLVLADLAGSAYLVVSIPAPKTVLAEQIEVNQDLELRLKVAEERLRDVVENLRKQKQQVEGPGTQTIG